MITFPVFLIALRSDHKPLMLRGSKALILPLFDDAELAEKFAAGQRANLATIAKITSAAELLPWAKATPCNLIWWNAIQANGKWFSEKTVPMAKFADSLERQAESEGSAGLN
ncbi:MAG TPA: hypothetical protein VGI40_07650 [Pirellulaceae bacterium]